MAETRVFREINFTTVDCCSVVYICESQKLLENFLQNFREVIGRITSEYNNITPQVVVLTRPDFTTTKLSFYLQVTSNQIQPTTVILSRSSVVGRPRRFLRRYSYIATIFIIIYIVPPSFNYKPVTGFMILETYT